MFSKNLEKEIFNYLYTNLSSQRYYHTLSVYELSIKLAKNYDANIYNIQMAALLHDCAKCMSLKEMIKYVKNNKIKIKYYDLLIKYAPQVLHSYISADIARNKFKTRNKDILNAIKYHTVGRINMSNCEKIIFVADALSLDRNYRNININKEIMFENLDKIFLLVLQNKINYVISKFQVLHPDIINIWNHYNK